MTFFKNDWISFHYNLDRNQTERISAWDVFTYDSICNSINPKDFKTELENTCQEILAHAQFLGKKLGVFLSGGVDSEIIARTLHKMDVPFECYFILFDNKLNEHEKEFVDIFQRQTGKEIYYINVDIERWLFDFDGLTHYQKTYRTFDIATPLQLWARTKISKDCSVISGLFEPHLHRVAASESCSLEWLHAFDEASVMARINFLRAHEFYDFPFFYLYRPELYAAYCYDPFVKNMINNPYKLSLVSTKKEMMKHYFPEMPTRPKYTGFEKIKELCLEAVTNHQHKFIDGQIRIYHRDIEKLFKNEK